MGVRLPRALLTVAAAVAFAATAVAQRAAAWNLLKNPDFIGGTTGWNLSATNTGTAGYESFFGSPINGSLRLQSYAANDTAHAEQCVDVAKWLAIDFSVRKLYDGESGTGTHAFKLQIHDAADCAGNVLGTIVLPEAGAPVDGNPVGAWVEVSVLGTPLPSGALSAKVTLDTNAGSAGVSYYIIDDVQVVPPDEIFPNAFETL